MVFIRPPGVRNASPYTGRASYVATVNRRSSQISTDSNCSSVEDGSSFEFQDESLSPPRMDSPTFDGGSSSRKQSLSPTRSSLRGSPNLRRPSPRFRLS